jgi:hypothetical protein
MMTLAGMSEADKKRYGLQMRVYKARKRMPRHISLMVFRDPSECVEVVEEALNRVGFVA